MTKDLLGFLIILAFVLAGMIHLLTSDQRKCRAAFPGDSCAQVLCSESLRRGLEIYDLVLEVR